MGKIEFSTEQLDAIYTTKCNLLVSAAAGSGKTAVLVNRVIERVCDPEADTDIDEILVLTFTNAAAAQMKEKIGNEIALRLAADPINENLKKQEALVHNAQITTIHSFCLYLIRNNFTQLDIDPAFRVGDPGEIKLICGEVMDELINEAFGGNLIENFELLADRFAAHGRIEGLKNILLEAYEHVCNQPFTEDYLREIRDDYLCEDEEAFMSSKCGSGFVAQVKEKLSKACEYTRLNLELIMEPGGCFVYEQNLKDDLEMLEAAADCDSYSELYDRLHGGLEFSRLKTPKKTDDILPESKEMAKKMRDEAKALATDAKALMAAPMSQILSQMHDNDLVYRALLDTLSLYAARLWERKKAEKVIDFSDMEHLALRLLYIDQDTPSATALEYRDVYKEILVDEYQDSNEIQEKILSAIAGKGNRFMVGDVKQSIYSFRNACPDIFMEKYNSYLYGNCEEKKIDLSANYRSRAEVVDAVNYIFERIMASDVGNIEYDEHARLNGKAIYPPNTGNKTELMLALAGRQKADERIVTEARMVADRIKSLMRENALVKDEETGQLRPCRYGDMVILLRVLSKWDEAFKKILEQEGIPAYIASKTGYFDTREIATLLNVMRLLDNPLDDIALYGVATSLFGGFDDNEMASIRTIHKGYLYDALKLAAGGNGDLGEGELSVKATDFLDFIDRYRELVPYTPIHELLGKLIDEFDYLLYVDSLPYGAQRRANVEMLLEKASKYEEGSFKGLYHFTQFIETLKSYKVEYGEAAILDEKADVVRIMSIHKSKGLEFPICFLSGMAKKFGDQDTKAGLTYTKELGFGFDYIDTDRMVKYPDIRRRYIAEYIRGQVRDEEMRILYVAMTRAKEKLIMTACVDNTDELMVKKKLQDLLGGQKEGKVLPAVVRRDLKSYLECVLSCLDIDKSNPYFDILTVSPQELEGEALFERTDKTTQKLKLRDDVTRHAGQNCENEASVLKRVAYRYDDRLKDMYSKVSVSELKHKAMDEFFEEEEGSKPKTIFETDIKDEYIPTFAGRKEKEAGGAHRGSAYHRVMELWNFEDADWMSQQTDVKLNLNQLVSEGRIDGEDAELVRPEALLTFLSDELASRMHEAARKGALFREQPFVLGIEADRVNAGFPANEAILIQGIIDAFFIEDGKAILLDYKTDRVAKPEDLAKRYKVQLDYYEEAIERITGLKVAQKLIYSVRFGKTISID